MTLAELRDGGTILLHDCVSGSHAYGLATETSDEDRRGVFCVPQKTLYGLGFDAQISDERNDEVYYELGRFVELAAKNNPNILELLATPARHILVRHEVMDLFPPELFLSRLCAQTFGRYAMSQIDKARGLNKKVVRPEPQQRKTVLDFCFVLSGAGSLPLRDWLAAHRLDQAQCGLAKVPHAKDVYALFVDGERGLGYTGIIGPKDANAVRLSSIPKGEAPAAHLVYHADGYSQHCRAHREYWAWVKRRNDVRYVSTLAHGGGYDAKNLMHTFRLLDMALEILCDGELRVERPNREELLAIKRGEFGYDELLARARDKIAAVESAAAKSSLPEAPDLRAIERRLVAARGRVYGTELRVSQ